MAIALQFQAEFNADLWRIALEYVQHGESLGEAMALAFDEAHAMHADQPEQAPPP